MSGRPRIQAHFASGGTAAFKEEDLIRRFDQFYAESETIVAGVAASIAANDLAKLGELVDLSQKLTDTHLRNQVTFAGMLLWCLQPSRMPSPARLARTPQQVSCCVPGWPRGSREPCRMVDLLSCSR